MRMIADHPTIAITGGDPCGVGPEIILKALSVCSRLPAGVIVIGDRRVFEETAQRLKRRLPWMPPRRRLTFLDAAHARRFQPGRPSRQAGAASLAYLDLAVALWRARRIQGLVTAPVTKWAIAEQEPGFVGQTEYLAKAMRRRDVVMMFISDRLRLALLTRHLPLGSVPRALTASLLRRTLRMTMEALRTQFQIARPRLAVCGLNPHAGEAGRCGREEQALMQPVLRSLRRQGAVCDGPFAADGLFAAPIRYDAVVCAYHDQGLIPFKMTARDRGCQLSVGLPIVRTSPDHGSALDIAGRGIANPGSMTYAIRLAVKLATQSASQNEERRSGS